MVIEIETYHSHHYKIEPYLRDIIIDLQKSDTWKIQLTIAIDFISSIDSEKKEACNVPKE